MEAGGSLGRPGVLDAEKMFQKYEAMKEDYDSLRKRYADLIATHSATVNKLELSQEEVNRVKKLYEEALTETSNTIRERNGLKQQCSAAIREWDSALRERNEYKEAHGKVQQQHEEAMKEINQAMAVRIQSNKEIKRLTEERDAALQEYSLIMSERDSVHRELEKLTDDLSQSKKQIKNLEQQNKELSDKIQEAVQETEVSKKRRDWAFNERDKIVRERESLRTLCDRLRRERDRAVSDLAEALSESEEIKKQKNIASKQLKELKEKMEVEHENRGGLMRYQYMSNSSSFSESRDSAIDSDLPLGHYNIRLPNVRGADHGLVLEPGVYISRIIPGSPASKEISLNVGDRVLFINDSAIENVQDAIVALSEDVDPITLTLSRSARHLSSPLTSNGTANVPCSQSSNRNSAACQLSPDSESAKSDKSDPNVVSSSSSGRHDVNGGKSSHATAFRDIFKVRLQKKKQQQQHHTLEEVTLARLDSAIASGEKSLHLNSSSNSGEGKQTMQTGSRKKRSKRNSKSASSAYESSNNKNGTWPRVFPKNSHSYTLPQTSENNKSMDSSTVANQSTQNHYEEPMLYSHHPSSLGPMDSSAVQIRRPSKNRERAPLSSMGWDLRAPNAAKSVGAITSEGMSLSSAGKSFTLAGRGSSGLGLVSQYGRCNAISLWNDSQNGLPNASGVAPHHRYSFGIFDPTCNKVGKGAPERNSVGSSIDFSVKSGNLEMEALDYYVKRMSLKNHNNSSESDHLDKVMPNPNTVTVVGQHQQGGNDGNGRGYSSPIRDVAANRYSSNSRYSDYYTDLPCSSGGGGSAATSQHSNYSFKPSFHHNTSSKSAGFDGSMLASSLLNAGGGGGAGGFHKGVPAYRNSDDFGLHQPMAASLAQNLPLELAGTFPRKKEPQRIRIPSNQSVTSRSSTEKDLRNSPMPPTYRIEAFLEPKPTTRRRRRVLDPGTGSRNSTYDYSTWPRMPASGELRQVRIDKFDNTEPLGIQIFCGSSGGVFVSNVTEGSLASQAGLQEGDQLLEVCGINMRSATYDLAASVLRQCGDSITMLVQYSPDKYKDINQSTRYDNVKGSSSDESHLDGDSSSSDERNNSSISDNESKSGSRSGSPTPCNSPQSTLVRKENLKKKQKKSLFQNYGSGGKGGALNLSGDGGPSRNSTGGNTLPMNSSLTQQQPTYAIVAAATQPDNAIPSEGTMRSTRSSGSGGKSGNPSSLMSGASIGTTNLSQDCADSGNRQEKTHFIQLQLMKNSSNLGVCLVGGNVVGIFIHSVQSDSVADRAGLVKGDQILEYNGTDLRQATAEEAAFELAKPLDKVGVLIQHNIQRYNEIKDQPGDGFYVRALTDYPQLPNESHYRNQSGSSDPKQLSFVKGEILYVDNTMYNGKPGRWRAWKVDTEADGGASRVWGIIPAKFKLEEEMLFRRGVGDLDGDRRASTITRRSFFRRKSYQRSSSRELASFSDVSINSYGDVNNPIGSVSMKDESSFLVLNCYQRVKRLHIRNFRPVVILGALSDLISERLVADFPYQYGRVASEVMSCSGQMIEKGLAKNVLIDYKRKGPHYECVSVSAVTELASRNLHGILDVSTQGVERLQKCLLHPIVVLVKFKTAKQLREIKDLRCDKITNKAGKELYDHAFKIEAEYKDLINVCVAGGTNISYVATQVKTAVETEQQKTLWVPE